MMTGPPGACVATLRERCVTSQPGRGPTSKDEPPNPNKNMSQASSEGMSTVMPSAAARASHTPAAFATRTKELEASEGCAASSASMLPYCPAAPAARATAGAATEGPP
jgi:hypothetical protein